jgi:hypothetical protein
MFDWQRKGTEDEKRDELLCIKLREIEDILAGLVNPKSWTDIQAHHMRTHNPYLKKLFLRRG